MNNSGTRKQCHPSDKKYWQENEDGYYVPIYKKEVTAIRELWNSDENKIQCNKYSRLIIIKAHIDLAGNDVKKLESIQSALRGKVLTDDLRNGGAGTLYDPQSRDPGNEFKPNELLPGDQIWFSNPMYDRINWDKIKTLPKNWQDYFRKRYKGEQGSNVYYLGKERVLMIYGQTKLVMTIDEYRGWVLSDNCISDWNSKSDQSWISKSLLHSLVGRTAADKDVTISDIEILSNDRPIVGRFPR